MPERAIVSSVEAIETFRAQLLLYLSKARPTLEEVTSEVIRIRNWVEYEQHTHWQNEFRKRARAYEEAQAALFSARISNLRQESSAEQMAVHRARRARDEAEEKLRVLKSWGRDYDNRVQPLVKQMEKLHTLLSNDLVKAAVLLAQTVKTLDDYAGVKPVFTAEPGTPASSPAPAASPPDDPAAQATTDAAPAKPNP